jgi:hypothetical protein
MSTIEHIVHELDALSEAELEQVSQYLAFLKYQSRKRSSSRINEDTLADLYARTREEDLELAESGLSEYNELLRKDDVL